MKNSFLSKFVKLLNKEVCHQEKQQKPALPITHFKPLPVRPSCPAVKKPMNIAAKSLKPQETVLSEGVFVKGELHFDKLLRINGTFEGNLQAEGRLIVGAKGKVQGDIDLEEAEINGQVIGNISVNHLTIGPHANIIGNIRVQTLTYHKGAKFSGHLDVDPDTSEIESYTEETTYQYSM